MLLATPLLCLAANIFHEARGEPTFGQILVGQVTLNRAHQDPNKICAVTMAQRQFSWTTKCVRPYEAGYFMRWRCKPDDLFAWDIALRVARTVLTGKMVILTCADHYFTTAVHPVWRHSMRFERAVGHHRFYISRGSQNTCTRISQS